MTGMNSMAAGVPSDTDEPQLPGPRPDEEVLWETSRRVIAELRPGILRDGGDLHLIDIVEDRVYVRLSGACTTCGLAGQTLGGIRRHLVKALGWPIRVLPKVD